MLFVAIPKPHAEGSNSSAPAIGIFRRQDVFAYNRTSLQNGPVVQLVRTLACHARGRRFEPVPGRHYAAMAQSVERVLGKDEVTSSNLVSSSKKSPEIARFQDFFFCFRHLVKSLLFWKKPFDYYLTTTGF